MESLKVSEDHPELDKLAGKNQALKDELHQIFIQMDRQLNKLDMKRRQEILEKQTEEMELQLKSQQIRANQKKYQLIKREIQSTWSQLENTYKIVEINQMESQLQIKQQQL